MKTDNLARLVCGDYQSCDSLKDIYDVLFHNIETMETRLADLQEDENDSNVTILGPYYARNLLETACTALLGRIDPFRILYVHKVQTHDEFNLGSKAKAAISWFGDIFEMGLSKEKKKPENMWNPNNEFSNISRGLLGDYYAEIFWNPAFGKVLDDPSYEREDALEYFRRSIDGPSNFIPFIRQKASQTYSSLSKGIHSELVIKPEIIYDRATVFDKISDVIQICSILGLVSHYISTSLCRLPTDNAFDLFKKITEWREKYGE